MNRQEQIKFIEDNYPLTTNHISNRRIRHDIFSTIETELQAYLLGFYAADGSIDEKRKTFRIHECIIVCYLLNCIGSVTIIIYFKLHN